MRIHTHTHSLSKDNLNLRQSTKQNVLVHFSTMDKIGEKIQKYGPFPPVIYNTFGKILLGVSQCTNNSL